VIQGGGNAEDQDEDGEIDDMIMAQRITGVLRSELKFS
jgi:hypothetical protein